ncbi:MAG TPA: condensation protein, partial [Acidobacteria bacterium]|nr:condensation protein [Acidobacteriota bacterium]
HIVSDGWSMGLLVRDLTALYAGRRADLPALPVPYTGFAAWQRTRLQGEREERLLAGW